MARDLIPPPSPAGRPSPDPQPWAEEKRRPEEPGEPAPPPAVAAPAPFRGRFGFVFGALAGIAVAAGVAFFLALGTTAPTSRDGAQLADHWSSWYPPSEDLVAASEAIAQHVEPAYKGNNGKQLVSVHGGPQYVINNGTPIPFGIKLLPADGTIRDLGSNGVFFTMTGTGKGGRISGGTPSVARHRLLRREALELALYSFRYVPHISMFVALLPETDPKASAKAAKGKKAKAAITKAGPQLQAVFFRPGDLKRELQSPLSKTLKPETKVEPKTLTPGESKRIDELTLSNLFLARFQPQPDGQLYLLLDRSAKPG